MTTQTLLEPLPVDRAVTDARIDATNYTSAEPGTDSYARMVYDIACRRFPRLTDDPHWSDEEIETLIELEIERQLDYLK